MQFIEAQISLALFFSHRVNAWDREQNSDLREWKNYYEMLDLFAYKRDCLPPSPSPKLCVDEGFLIVGAAFKTNEHRF